SATASFAISASPAKANTARHKRAASARYTASILPDSSTTNALSINHTGRDRAEKVTPWFTAIRGILSARCVCPNGRRAGALQAVGLEEHPERLGDLQVALLAQDEAEVRVR